MSEGMKPFVDAALLRETAKPVHVAIVYGVGAFILSRLMA